GQPKDEITVAGGDSTYVVMFGQARQVLSNVNTKTTSVDGTETTQDLATFTEYRLDTGRLNAQRADGTWITKDPVYLETSGAEGGVTLGEVRQRFEVITGQARLTQSDSFRT